MTKADQEDHEDHDWEIYDSLHPHIKNIERAVVIKIQHFLCEVCTHSTAMGACLNGSCDTHDRIEGRLDGVLE